MISHLLAGSRLAYQLQLAQQKIPKLMNTGARDAGNQEDPENWQRKIQNKSQTWQGCSRN